MPGCQGRQVHALQRVRALAAVWAALLALAAVPAGAQTPVEAARQLYNQGKYENAIKLAAKLRTDPANADVANLILGRSQLERFRQSADRADLVAAREALREIRPSTLGAREQAEYLVGLGELLYLDESYGAAAEIFVTAFERSQELGVRGFDRVFDWWATALDRQAQSGFVEDRDALYGEILFRAQAALAQSPSLAAPAYWLVVATRSLGDTNRAWDAAIAAWVRAPLADDHGTALRADLDRLVLQAIIPERVRQLASTDSERERQAARLRLDWETVKKDWSSPR
jgi:hypothetical protein